MGFLGGCPIANLIIDVKNLGNDKGKPNGNTVISGTTTNAIITINLNSEKLDRSKLSIARTILHEMIHAELSSMVIEAGWYKHFKAFAANYKGDEPFQEIWAYYNQYGTYMKSMRPGWQHEYMADNYIEKIANGF